jgi:hypothetical protein
MKKITNGLCTSHSLTVLDPSVSRLKRYMMSNLLSEGSRAITSVTPGGSPC